MGHHRRILVLLFLCVSLASPMPSTAEPLADCAAPVSLDDGWQVADAAGAGFDPARLCAALRAFRTSPRNLHAVVVERGGRVVAETYRAGLDVPWLLVAPRRVTFGPGTLHDMRSISKSVVGLLWGIAQADVGLPPVQTPVLDLFPHLADLRTGGRERITLEDLLSMRSGLAWDEMGRYGGLGNDENGLAWRGDIPRYVFDRPLATGPGRHFNYDGGHTAVLAELIQQRTGSTLQEYVRRKLFEPLGITHWEWGTDLRGRARAYAGLRLRPRDLARLGRLVLAGGTWQGREVVPAAWLQASFAPRVPYGEPGMGSDSNYGYQWWLGTVRAGGRSFAFRAAVGNGGQRLFIVPDLDLVVVLTAGEYNDPGVAPELRRVLDLIVESAAAGSAATP
ncbi:MAG TPA: serine hydrolase [Ramlibacter sp.]|uniref:serine hydrolase domain-containing protein n=1 Tax=Ramlibacter sp. TaxID=1917967 RepID=UPI002ECFD074